MVPSHVTGLRSVARAFLGRPIAGLLRQHSARRKFRQQFDIFRARSERLDRFALDWKHKQPCLGDDTPTTGFDRHYVYHLAWAARILAQTRPPEHVDIASSLYFCTIISAFIPVQFYDYRPAPLALDGLVSNRADLTRLCFSDASIRSLSCMHVVEHVGLGRYGDELDPDADLRAMAELQRVLAPGGSLLFVVPVGRPTIRFNAHRIYSYRQIVSAFDRLALREWALIREAGIEGPIVNAPERLADSESYGCGCFWFQRRA